MELKEQDFLYISKLLIDKLNYYDSRIDTMQKNIDNLSKEKSYTKRKNTLPTYDQMANSITKEDLAGRDFHIKYLDD